MIFKWNPWSNLEKAGYKRGVDDILVSMNINGGDFITKIKKVIIAKGFDTSNCPKNGTGLLTSNNSILYSHTFLGSDSRMIEETMMEKLDTNDPIYVFYEYSSSSIVGPAANMSLSLKIKKNPNPFGPGSPWLIVVIVGSILVGIGLVVVLVVFLVRRKKYQEIN